MFELFVFVCVFVFMCVYLVFVCAVQVSVCSDL